MISSHRSNDLAKMPVQDMDLIRFVLEYVFSESALTLYIVLRARGELKLIAIFYLQFSYKFLDEQSTRQYRCH